ncbi:MAG: hypothetical protein ACYTF1_09720 [Planctomycetota bacterium]|jgi:hypothetical protein
MSENDQINLEELELLGEASRRKYYIYKMYLELFRSSDITITLRSSQPLPQIADIPLVDTPTFRELFDYLNKAILKIDDSQTSHQCNEEMIYEGREVYNLHIDFSTDHDEQFLTLSAEYLEPFERNPGIVNKKPKEEGLSIRNKDLPKDQPLPQMKIAEFKARIKKARPILLCWGILYIVSILGLFIVSGALVFFIKPSSNWVSALIFITALIGGMILWLYLGMNNNERIFRHYNLCCPYCLEPLMDEWQTYNMFLRNSKRHKQNSLLNEAMKENCFHTGLCKNCKADIIDSEP